MNYGSFIIKILEKPIQTAFNDEIYVIKFMGQYPTIATKKFETKIKIAIWRSSLDDLSTYFFVNDYIIIEGYISFRDTDFNKKNSMNRKQIEISAFRVYPFLF